MLQQMRRHGKHAALHFDGGHVLGFKFFGGVRVGFPGIDFRAAGKHIEGSKIIFGPRMNRQMRFGDDHHAGDAVRIEGVKHHIHNPGFGVFGRFNHDGFNFMNIVQDFGIAVVEFDEQMSSE